MKKYKVKVFANKITTVDEEQWKNAGNTGELNNFTAVEFVKNQLINELNNGSVKDVITVVEPIE